MNTVVGVGLEYSLSLVVCSAVSLVITLGLCLTQKSILEANCQRYITNVVIFNNERNIETPDVERLTGNDLRQKNLRSHLVRTPNPSAKCFGILWPNKLLLDALLTTTYFGHGILQTVDLQIADKLAADMKNDLHNVACIFNIFTNFLFNVAVIFPTFSVATKLCFKTCVRSKVCCQAACLLLSTFAAVSLTVSFFIFPPSYNRYTVHLALSTSYFALLVNPLLRLAIFSRHKNAIFRTSLIVLGDADKLDDLKYCFVASTVVDYICLLPNVLLSWLVAYASNSATNELMESLDSAPSLLTSCSSTFDTLTLEGSNKLVVSKVFQILVVTAASCTGCQLLLQVFLHIRFPYPCDVPLGCVRQEIQYISTQQRPNMQQTDTLNENSDTTKTMGLHVRLWRALICLGKRTLSRVAIPNEDYNASAVLNTDFGRGERTENLDNNKEDLPLLDVRSENYTN